MFSLCSLFPWYAFPSFPLHKLLLSQGHPTITPTSWKFSHSPRINCKCAHPWSHPWFCITMWVPWISCACSSDWRVLFFHLSVPPRQSRPSVCLGSPHLLQYFPRVKELSKHCSMDTRFIQRGSLEPKIHRKHSDLLKDYISSHTHTHTHTHKNSNFVSRWTCELTGLRWSQRLRLSKHRGPHLKYTYW